MQEEAPEHGQHDLHASVGDAVQLWQRWLSIFLESLSLHQERHAHYACHKGLLIGVFGLPLISAIPHYRNLPHGSIDIMWEMSVDNRALQKS